MRSHPLLRAFFALCLASISTCASHSIFAQTNLIQNGGFEQFSPQDNLWDGVDNEGFLAGSRRGLPALTESGAVNNLPMPISVNMVDINGDGLPDLVTADPQGYFRVYFNSGTKTEPKFTHCEMVPLFLSRSTQPGGRPPSDDSPNIARFGTKLSLFDWSKRGVLDLMVCDYAGEVMFIPNSGNAKAPDWRQPRTVEDVLVRTTKSGQLWGNLFAPAGFDWDHDGRPDLLLGEGTYSANSVHLLLNKGGGARPEFSEDANYDLAYGNGREQLVPAVADFNGDGHPDLLVGDRKGGIAVHLGSATWKPGAELPMTSMISFGRGVNLGGCVAPYAADWNGDGLFDLILGKTNGRIAVAINRGTKEQPKFDPPFEVKGEDVWKHGSMGVPNVWSVDSGFEKGNLYGYATVVDASQDASAAPVEGAHCFKAGYFPSLNKVFRKPQLDLPPNQDRRDLIEIVGKQMRPFPADRIGRDSAPSNFVMHNILKAQLKVGATYTLSFKVKGAGVREARWMFGYGALKDGSSAKDLVQEINYESGNFSAGSQWAVVTKSFAVRFKNQTLRDVTPTMAAVLELKFTLTPGEGVIYIDDVQLVEKT